MLERLGYKKAFAIPQVDRRVIAICLDIQDRSRRDHIDFVARSYMDEFGCMGEFL